MKKILIVFTFFLVNVSIGLAQKINNIAEEELLSEQQIVTERFIRNENTKFGGSMQLTNQADINQAGSRNLANVTQQTTGNNDPNVVFIMQAGVLNEANLEQDGSGNEAELKQVGNRNKYEGEISGTNIFSGVNQAGNNNQIDQQIRGRNLEYQLIQSGNNNEIIQIETGVKGQQYEVKQEGSGMTIKIINGSGIKP